MGFVFKVTCVGRMVLFVLVHLYDGVGWFETPTLTF
jgi:hypothetical protein